jgi:hypothetical protein
MSLYREYKDDPRKALEVLFDLKGGAYRYHGKGRALFLFKGYKDKNGVRYGSYGYVYENELKDRQYDVEWGDYMPSIRYTDVVFNPQTRECEPV